MKIYKTECPRQVGKTRWAMKILCGGVDAILVEPSKNHELMVKRLIGREFTGLKERVISISDAETLKGRKAAKFVILDDVPLTDKRVKEFVYPLVAKNGSLICLNTSKEMDELSYRIFSSKDRVDV